MIQTIANFLRIAVIGAGSWGTTLAHHLASSGHLVHLWSFEPEVAIAINQTHENPFFLAGLDLHPAIKATSDIFEALSGAALVVLVIPSHFFRRILRQFINYIPAEALIVSCTKGIEQGTGYTMCEVLKNMLPKIFHYRLCCLSGPSFAREMVLGAPTVVTVASRDFKAAHAIQLAFAHRRLRVYTSSDLIGVELGGAIKNPLAIAAGMVTGLKLGCNTLAALITRGLAEMTRLVKARGGHMTTVSGLAGLGDLVLTCTNYQSRNFSVGLRLAQGEPIDTIITSMKNVAEGVINTQTVLEMATKLEVEIPIIEAVYRVIYQHVLPDQALQELMGRQLKPEYY